MASPYHDTIRRIFMHVDPEAFRQCFADCVASLGISLEGHQIAIDGKTLRGSRSKAKGKQAIHMVSAWIGEHNLVIGQQKTEEKSNEITAIPKLLEQLVIKDTVISIDASSRWPGIQSAVAVYSNHLVDGEKYGEVRYFISSLPPVAEQLSGIIRRHWGIENGLHWSLDVGFREDDCLIHSGYSAENLAILRHIALHLIKQDETIKGGIARKLKLAGVDDRYLESILFKTT